MDTNSTAITTRSALHSTWEKPKDRHQLLAEKLGIELRGPGDLPCLACHDPLRDHERNEANPAQRGHCEYLSMASTEFCPCEAFVWDEVEEDSDAGWDREKDERAFGNEDYYESGDY